MGTTALTVGFAYKVPGFWVKSYMTCKTHHTLYQRAEDANTSKIKLFSGMCVTLLQVPQGRGDVGGQPEHLQGTGNLPFQATQHLFD